MNNLLLKHLEEFVTPERKDLFHRIIKDRTNYITVLLEDIYQPQNASAVLRTCDCFGIQNIHIIENDNEYQVNPDVALGSDKWVQLNYHNTKQNNTVDAFNQLKSEGYKIIATTPHTNDIELENFDITDGKFALAFGTEQRGLSKVALENADGFLKIPMYGFTESFNISVSAAITLHYLTTKLRQSDINWKLTNEEQESILLDWLKTTIKASDQIIKKFNQTHQ